MQPPLLFWHRSLLKLFNNQFEFPPVNSIFGAFYPRANLQCSSGFDFSQDLAFSPFSPFCYSPSSLPTYSTVMTEENTQAMSLMPGHTA